MILRGITISGAFVCFCAPTITAQTIFPRGIVNAASFAAPGLPGGGIARGSIFSIFGRNLGPASSPTLAFPLTINLGGVSIKVSQGATSVDAIPLFVSAGQVNAIMPSNAPLGLVSVRVTYSGSTGNPSPVRVVDSSFGIFSVNTAGLGPGVLFNYVTADNQSVNSTQVAAKPGDLITLYGTGLGAVSGPDNIAPPAGDLPITADVSVGGQKATVLYHGRTPCCAALDQIVFKVPDNAPLGCWVPLYLRTNNAVTGNVVTMAISNDGSACTDALNPAAQTFIKGGRMGAFIALRSGIREDIGTLNPIDVTTEFAGSVGSVETGSQFAFNPFISLPPAGTCTVYTAPGDLFSGNSVLPGGLSTGRILSTGSSTSFTGPSGTITADSLFKTALNIGPLGIDLSGNTAKPLFFNPGAYTFSTPAGADLPSVSASFNIPAPVAWLNRDQVVNIDRSQPLTLTWTNTTQTVSIVGAAVDLPTNSSALFQCIAPAAATSLTVPAAILSALPASRRLASQTKAVLFVGTLPLGAASVFTTGGLDTAVLLPIFVNGRTVSFR
jgi:uncharacterized protein (TIGR03437 family)